MEIDRDYALKIFKGNIRRLAVCDPGDAGGVDENVDPLAAFQQLPDGALDRILGGDIRLEGEDVAVKLPGGSLETLGSEVDQRDGRSSRDQFSGDRKSDSGCASGD
jgi:hypothetical protein